MHLEVFKQVVQDRQDLFEEINEPVLTHDDLHGHNILILSNQGEWVISGLLDFDKTWAGHGESDLARMDLWGMTTTHFWSGYSSFCKVNQYYEARRPIYQLLWCLEYARETEQHLKDTARICIELGIKPITTFPIK